MQFELYTLLATTILLISLATIVFAFYSYVLFRVREGKKLRKQAGHGATPAPAPEPAPEPAMMTEPAAEPSASLVAVAAAVGASKPVAARREVPAAMPPPEPPKPVKSGPRFFRPYDPAK